MWIFLTAPAIIVRMSPDRLRWQRLNRVEVVGRLPALRCVVGYTIAPPVVINVGIELFVACCSVVKNNSYCFYCKKMSHISKGRVKTFEVSEIFNLSEIRIGWCYKDGNKSNSW